MAHAQKTSTSQAETTPRRSAAEHAGSSFPWQDSPRIVTQRRRIQELFGPATQRQEVGGDESPLNENFEAVQHQAADQADPLRRQSGSAKPNHIGLPDGLKSGIESLSGMSMDHVRVHYDSPQPAQIQALAYAQGSEIHLAPGQERHLPHEAWHVVQQRQGRVRPTMQLAGVGVNDEIGLEKEADSMGLRAISQGAAMSSAACREGLGTMASPGPDATLQRHAQGPGKTGAATSMESDAAARPAPRHGGVVQRAVGFEFESGNLISQDGQDLSKDVVYRGDGFRIDADTKSGMGHNIEFVTDHQETVTDAVRLIGKAVEFAHTLKSGQVFEAGGWSDRYRLDIRDKLWNATMQHTEGVLLEEMAVFLQAALQLNEKEVEREAVEGLHLSLTETDLPTPDKRSSAPVQTGNSDSGEGREERKVALGDGPSSVMEPNEPAETALSFDAPITHTRVAGFVQLVMQYVRALAGWDGRRNEEGPKNANTVMSRTDFHAILHSLDETERSDFIECIREALAEERFALEDRLIPKPYPFYGDEADPQDNEVTIGQWIDSMTYGRDVEGELDDDSEDDEEKRSDAASSSSSSRLKRIKDKRRRKAAEEEAKLQSKEKLRQQAKKQARKPPEKVHVDKDLMSPPKGFEGFQPIYSMGALGMDGDKVVIEVRGHGNASSLVLDEWPTAPWRALDESRWGAQLAAASKAGQARDASKQAPAAAASNTNRTTMEAQESKDGH